MGGFLVDVSYTSPGLRQLIVGISYLPPSGRLLGIRLDGKLISYAHHFHGAPLSLTIVIFLTTLSNILLRTGYHLFSHGYSDVGISPLLFTRGKSI